MSRRSRIRPARWDLRDLLTVISYPNSLGTVTRGYDDAGRWTSVTDWLNNITSFGYDADSNLTSETKPNGTTATVTVDSADRLTATSHAPTSTPSSPFASFGYSRDDAGRFTAVDASGVPADDHTWGYSSLDQLTTDTANTHPYDHDDADNLIQLGDGTIQAFDDANQLTSATATVTLRGATSDANSTSSSLTVPLTSGVKADDQILLGVTLTADGSVTTPTGYTHVGTWSTGTLPADAKLAMFRRTADGTETYVALSFSATFAKAAAAAVHRGVDSINPIDANTNATASTATSLTLPGVTPTLAGGRLVAITAGNNLLQGSWTPPTGMTEHVDQPVGGLLDPKLAVALADQPLTSTSSTGDRTATYSAPADLAGASVALKPARTTYNFDTRGNRTTAVAPAGTTTYGNDQGGWTGDRGSSVVVLR